MTDIENQITELTKLWYGIIGPGHHKDRDCHWSIVKQWSYGNPPRYYVEHYGYLHENSLENKSFTSEQEATEALAKELILALKLEYSWAYNAKTDLDHIDQKHAKYIRSTYSAFKKICGQT